MDRALLILDLDETLVYATRELIGTHCDFQILDYFVQKRPYLGEFLDRAFGWFQVAVWTSAGSIYASELVPRIFDDPAALQFVWGGDRCTIRRDLDTDTFYHIKDLKKVKRRGFRLERVLMIDDTPRKLSRNYGNHLALEEFKGDRGDRELLEVLPYLGWLSTQKNFRAIDKRHWKNWAQPSNKAIQADGAWRRS